MLKPDIIEALQHLVGTPNVLTEPEEKLVYECDGLTMFKAMPEVVVFPLRHAGGGGCLPGQSSPDPFCRSWWRDRAERRSLGGRGRHDDRPDQAQSHPGNRSITSGQSSNRASSISGSPRPCRPRDIISRLILPANKPARSAAMWRRTPAVYTLKYGVTTNHVLGLEVVLPNGQIIDTGGPAEDYPGYDLTGILVGSGRLLGIVTKIIVRLMRKTERLRP